MRGEVDAINPGRERPAAWKVVGGLLGVCVLNLAFLMWCQSRLATWLGWAIAGAPNYG